MDAILGVTKNPYQTLDVTSDQISGGEKDRSFGNLVQNAVDTVNDYNVQADQKVESFLQGEDVPIHEVMVEMGKADTSIRLMTTVTQKVLAAYNDIARLQV
jgi:flagellar hook-basal body complex protein FliE